MGVLDTSPAGCLFFPGSSPGPSLMPPVWTGSGRSSGRTVGHTGVARGLCAPLAGRMPGTQRLPAWLCLNHFLVHDFHGAVESWSCWGLQQLQQAPEPSAHRPPASTHLFLCLGGLGPRDDHCVLQGGVHDTSFCKNLGKGCQDPLGASSPDWPCAILGGGGAVRG